MSVQQQHIEWLEALCNKKAHNISLIQTLWSGYGECFRALLQYNSLSDQSLSIPVVVKCTTPSNATNHPRGWNSDTGHQRKLRSFAIENAFYKQLQPFTSTKCYIPRHIASEAKNGNTILVMEDLTQAGFSHHATSLTVTQAETVLRWLACFHAQFVIKRSDISHNKINVWEHGTYWHLSTRMDEFNAMQECDLKGKAHAVSEKLDECEYQTLVHGDAKVANFCFTSCFEHCAAVDFQYVGYGVGIKDVAYFLGSALSTSEQSEFLSYFLSIYFEALKDALRFRNTQLIDSNNAEDAPYPFAFLSEDDIATLEIQWRNLFSFACADFHRFLSGWSPTHWKIDTLLQQQTQHALSLLT